MHPRIKARQEIMKFVEQRGYTYSIEEVIGSYILYVKIYEHIGHIMMDIMKNVGGYVRLLADGEEGIINYKECYMDICPKCQKQLKEKIDGKKV